MNIYQKVTSYIAKKNKIPYIEVDFVMVDFIVNEFETQSKIKDLKRFLRKRSILWMMKY